MTTPLTKILDAHALFNKQIVAWALFPATDRGADAVFLQQLKEFAADIKAAVRESQDDRE